jgi:AraC-like DNA-binding protein
MSSSLRLAREFCGLGPRSDSVLGFCDQSGEFFARIPGHLGQLFETWHALYVLKHAFSHRRVRYGAFQLRCDVCGVGSLFVWQLTFINERRIQRAQQLLVSQSLAIGDLALQVGFLSPSHFARIFRRHVGLSPSEYRQSR